MCEKIKSSPMKEGVIGKPEIPKQQSRNNNQPKLCLKNNKNESIIRIVNADLYGISFTWMAPMAIKFRRI